MSSFCKSSSSYQARYFKESHVEVVGDFSHSLLLEEDMQLQVFRVEEGAKVLMQL